MHLLLNRFEDNRADAVVKFGFEVGNIVEVTNSTPGTSGSNGARYFSAAVTLSAPKVRP